MESWSGALVFLRERASLFQFPGTSQVKAPSGPDEQLSPETSTSPGVARGSQASIPPKTTRSVPNLDQTRSTDAGAYVLHQAGNLATAPQTRPSVEISVAGRWSG